MVVGGLAVNAHGHPCSTGGVDDLVDAGEAFEGEIVLTHRAAVPFEVDGVPIDDVTAAPRFPEAVRYGPR